MGNKVNRVYMDGYKPSNTYSWIPMDTKELFEKNLKDNPLDESLNYYLQNPIKYELNNYGFRTPDDFNSEDEGNVFLGCSHTFGIGHHLENTWSYKVNKYVGGKFWNLGIGGTGVMTHYRLLKELYEKLKIKNIFYYAPMYCRYEFLFNDKPETIYVGDFLPEGNVVIKNNIQMKMGDFIMDSLINKSQMEITYNTHIDAIKWLSHEIGCDYYVIDEIELINNDGSLRARDLSHLDTAYQTVLSEKFIKMYNEKNNL